MNQFVGISRTALSITLALLSAVCLTLALVRFWVSDVIYDEDRFAGASVRVFQREDVRREVRRVVVNQIIEQQPDLVSARPLIETVVDTALRSKAFDSIMASAARDFHRSVFETERRTLILNIADIMTVAVAGIRAYDPELADRVPGGADVGALELATRNTGTRMAEFDRRITALHWVLAGGAVATFAGSVLLGSSLRRSIITTGIALVGCAIVVWFGVALVAEVLRRQIGGNVVLGDAVAAAWQIYAEELVWWMWLQALTGIFAATVMSSVVAARPTAERMTMLHTRIEAAWRMRTGRVLLSGLGAITGVLLLFAPIATLRILGQAAGLALLYFAGAELLRALGIARERVPRRRAERPERRVTDFIPRVLAGSGMVAGLLFAGFVFWSNREALRAEPASATPAIERCNGMAELCDQRLDQVVFAATHNSMSAAEEPGWYFAEQIHPIRRQLEDGVRGLLIDVYYGYPTNRGVRTDPAVGDISERLEPWFGPEALASARNLANLYGPIPEGSTPALYLCHGFCELGATAFDRAIGQLVSFLQANPHEVVILVLQDYAAPADIEASFERTRLIDYVYTLIPEEPLPTLRELIEVDRRVVVFSENASDLERPAWYHPAFELIQDTPFSFRSTAMFTCEPFRGELGSPLFLVNHWISRSPPSPRDAEIANAQDVLSERVHRCQDERGRLPNLIAVNFYESGDLFSVVEALNREHYESLNQDEDDNEGGDEDED